MYSIYAACLGIFVFLAYHLNRRYHRISLAHIPGPKAESWWLGNAKDLLLPECGVTEGKWQKEYGSIFRIKGGIGEDRLYVADPKALQHILQKGGYNYSKVPGDNAAKALRGGRGLFWAEGHVHKRYRKATAGVPDPLTFLPVFRNTIKHVVSKWDAIVAADPSGKSAIVDMNSWMGRAALDVMGKASCDYDLGAVEDVENPLRTAYDMRSSTIFDISSPMKLRYEAIHNDIPVWILNTIHKYMPGARNIELRRNMAYMNKIIGEMVRNTQRDLREGNKEILEEKRDMMNMLVKASATGDPSRFLTDEEIVEQIVSTIFGGHGTVALSMTWMMYEIAKRPEVQARMRAEILEMKATVETRGDVDDTPLDMDGLHYTDAVIRECFRFQSIVIAIRREAIKDDVLPLHKPMLTTSGKLINEMPIPKGTRLFIAVQGYHLNEDVWGDDVLEFKPERWFVSKGTTGLFGNVLNFSSGIRSCPGRKFSVVEMQTFLVGMLSKYEFSIPEDSKRVVHFRTFAMLPMVEGEFERGPQLPIKITALPVQLV